MRREAERLGWEGHAVDSVAWQRVVSSGSPKYKRWRLEELLGIMAEEAVAGLPPWHINVADVSRIGRLSGTPGRDKLLRALRTEGHLAARCHISVRAHAFIPSLSCILSFEGCFRDRQLNFTILNRQ
jgi:tRNA G26 N,N-dimethylase Trm1